MAADKNKCHARSREKPHTQMRVASPSNPFLCVLRSLKDIFFDSTVAGKGILYTLSKMDFAETVIPMVKFKQ